MVTLRILPAPDVAWPSARSRFESYLRMERRASENTVCSYLSDLQQFEAWLQTRGKAIESATRDEVRDYFASGLADGLTAKSARRKLSTLRTFYTLLLDDEVITRNPTRGVPLPKTEKSLPRILSDSEVNRMVCWAAKAKDPHGRHCSLRDKAILLTLFASGLRASELVDLKLADLDLDGGFVKIWNGKGGKDGIAPLTPRAVTALRVYLRRVRPIFDEEQKLPHLFLSWQRSPLTRQALFYRIRNIARGALGKEVGVHQFRHACATALIKGGADVRDVQAILRHSDINTTQVYVHMDLTYLRGVYERSHPRA